MAETADRNLCCMNCLNDDERKYRNGYNGCREYGKIYRNAALLANTAMAPTALFHRRYRAVQRTYMTEV